MSIIRKLPFERIRIRRTTLIITACFSFLIGLWIAQYNYGFANWLIFIPLALAPLILSRKPKAIICVILIGVSIGLLRGAVLQQDMQSYEKYYGRQITLQGKVIDDPTYDNRGQTQFHITKNNLDLPGKIRIRSYVSPHGVEKGDLITARGTLRDGFGSYQAEMTFAQIEVNSRDGSLLTQARNAFFASIYTVLPEPQASLGLGFLVGLRALLPDDLLNDLSRTGLTHIVAVSGYNLTVLVRVARRSFMRISKFSATAISFGLILFFLAITGLAPSIFRASVVAVFALIAWYYGRPIRPLMLLGLSSAITAAVNPFLLWNDIGWWLSFTAFFGVLILAPLVTQRLFHKDGSELFMPVQIAIETTCAQIMALPIIMVIFGEVSLISVFANILIVPFIPIAMAATFLAGLAGLVAPALAGWMAMPAKVMLIAMTSGIAFMSQLSWALIEVEVSWLIALIWYTAVLLVCVALYRSLNMQQRTKLANVNHLE